MLGAWEGTERTLTQGPYTFCSPQQVLPTMRTCPLFLAHHTHVCTRSLLCGAQLPLGDAESPPQGLHPGLLGTGL